MEEKKKRKYKKHAAKKGRLSIKLVGIFAISGIIICCCCCYIGYRNNRNEITKMYNDTGYRIIGMILSHISGDQLETYLKTMKKDDAYEAMAMEIDSLREHMDVNYIYIAHLSTVDYETLTYIYDADNPDDDLDKLELGDIGSVNPNFKEAAKELVESKQRVDNYFFSNGQFGYNTSAILPVMNSKDEVVAVIGVEVPVENIDHIARDYLKSAVIISCCYSFFSMTVWLLILNRNIIQPIKIIMEEAENFVERETMSADRLSLIHTKDEIQYLAEAFQKMEMEINAYIEKVRYVAAEKERAGVEIHVAEEVRRKVLPLAFPEVDGVKIAASLIQAPENSADFYDCFFVKEGCICLMVASAQGDLLSRALTMMTMKIMVRNYALAGKKTSEVFQIVNNQLCEQSKNNIKICAFLGILNLETGELNYSNAGNPPPVICQAGGGCTVLDEQSGFAIADMEATNFEEFQQVLQKNDTLFLYTDGIYNIGEEQKTKADITSLFIGSVHSGKEGYAEEKVAELEKEILQQKAERKRDITILGIQYTMHKKENKADDVVKKYGKNYPALKQEVPHIVENLRAHLIAYDCEKGSEAKLIEYALEKLFIRIVETVYMNQGGAVRIGYQYSKEEQRFTVYIKDRGRISNPFEEDSNSDIMRIRREMDEVSYESGIDGNLCIIQKKIVPEI